MGSCRTPFKPTACALVAALLVVSPAQSFAATPDDPFEGVNRGLYAIHRVLDRTIYGPAGRAYKAVIPKPIRKGFRNLINNLKEPGIAFNDLLQGHPTRAGRTTARFVINSTAGLGGLMDQAYNIGLPYHENGFATTAGRYGVQQGPYLFIPFIGPTTFRELLGQLADLSTDPLAWAPWRGGEVLYSRAIIDGLDERAEADEQLKAIDNMSTDPYASLRSLYLQSRAALVSEAVTGVQGSAEPVFEEFDDPSATAPVPAPAPDAAPAAPATPAPVTELENRLIDEMLARPLTPVRSAALSSPVESARAG